VLMLLLLLERSTRKQANAVPLLLRGSPRAAPIPTPQSSSTTGARAFALAWRVVCV
jgi:hypothetical protein